jgi:hypothetical protein
MLSSSSSKDDKTRTYLDSGCSYHTFRKTSIPKSVNIDTSDIVNIQTAHSGTFIQSSGRAADAGLLKDVIVVEDSLMPANLASLAVFDRAGYKTVVENGIATVSKGDEIVLVAKLTNKNLYEFDAIPLLQPYKATNLLTHAMLGSVPVKSTLELWHRRLNQGGPKKNFLMPISLMPGLNA